jgi:hypothetical protein
VKLVRILFHKISDERHVLELVRDDGGREQVECETRSYLQHDLLHYAAEAEAKLDDGFWGNLARGKTLADMNDRTGESMGAMGGRMPAIEQAVGVLSGSVKGVTAEALVAGFRDYAATADTSVPDWFTVEFVSAVKERMRRLLGRWKATRYGDSMELSWPG